MEEARHRPTREEARIEVLERKFADDERVISFAGGLPDPSLFPKRRLASAFERALATGDDPALQYGFPEGDAELRELIAIDLQKRGAAVDAEDVLITSGAQQAIRLATEVLLRPGDAIGVDAECYVGALDAFRARSLRLVPPREPARASYVLPISNPRGTSLDENFRQFLLDDAQAHGRIVLDDHAYADTVFSGTPIRPLLAEDPTHVVHVGTVSKILCPGLRVGWLVTKHADFAALRVAKRTADLQAGSLAQRILLEYLRSGHLPQLIDRSRKRYRARAKRLRALVVRHLPNVTVSRPEGGFSLWLETNLTAPDVTLLEAAAAECVAFDAGGAFSTRPAGGLALRLCYSSVPLELMEEGVRRVARGRARLGAP